MIPPFMCPVRRAAATYHSAVHPFYQQSNPESRKGVVKFCLKYININKKFRKRSKCVKEENKTKREIDALYRHETHLRLYE